MTDQDRDVGGPDRLRETRARADAQRAQLQRSIIDYMEREREATSRLAQQSALLDLVPDPIFARNSERQISFWNAAAESLYGYTRDEVLGRDAGQVLLTIYPIPLEEIERFVVENGSWEGDLAQTTKSGRRITVASRWGAMYDERGELAGLLEINRDVTERLRAQSQREHDRAELQRERMSNRLVRSQRLESLGHLAGGIAHDFNNLLAVISGYAGMGAKRIKARHGELDAATTEQLASDLAQIIDAADRAAALTRQLLAFARQDAVRPEVIDANATVAEMRELLARTLGPHIQLSTRLAPDISPIRIDPGQLGQILVNLAVNSREAMPEGGRLTIETSLARFQSDRPLSHGVLPAGTYARLRVTDNGVGMTRDVADRAFDPFFTTRAVGEGTGLGLATVYGIAVRAGGQVELYSEPDIGTTVTVLLPAADDPVTNRLPEAVSPPMSAAGETILVVDDEPALQEIISGYLVGAGYTVLEASGSLEALRVATGAGPDLLLTDVVMPEMLGQQLYARLRERHPELKVLFISGFAITSAEGQGQLEGELLQKPFSEIELLTAVAKALASGHRPV